MGNKAIVANGSDLHIEGEGELKGSNYVIYEGMNDTNYWMYVRVDNTWLEIFGPKKDKEGIKAFVAGLGYYKE